MYIMHHCLMKHLKWLKWLISNMSRVSIIKTIYLAFIFFSFIYCISWYDTNSWVKLFLKMTRIQNKYRSIAHIWQLFVLGNTFSQPIKFSVEEICTDSFKIKCTFDSNGEVTIFHAQPLKTLLIAPMTDTKHMLCSDGQEFPPCTNCVIFM